MRKRLDYFSTTLPLGTRWPNRRSQ